MTKHSPNVALLPALALARHSDPHEQSALVCSLALEACPPSSVARYLHRSDDLVRRWGRGQGSPNLVQIFSSPERFGRAVLALAGQVYVPVEPDPRTLKERLWLAMLAFGTLLASVRPERPVSEQTDEELDQIIDQGQPAADEILRVVAEARAEQARRKAAREGGR